MCPVGQGVTHILALAQHIYVLCVFGAAEYAGRTRRGCAARTLARTRSAVRCALRARVCVYMVGALLYLLVKGLYLALPLLLMLLH